MSQAYASTAATNPLRRLGLRLWQDPDSRSTSIGLAAVVVFHLLLFLLAPIFLRIEHLPDLRVPTLFVCGDRDPFGTPGELAEAQALVAGPVTSVTIAGGRHELVGADGAVSAAVGNWLGSSRP